MPGEVGIPRQAHPLIFQRSECHTSSRARSSKS
jgi:hypothetical protein